MKKAVHRRERHVGQKLRARLAVRADVGECSVVPRVNDIGPLATGAMMKQPRESHAVRVRSQGAAAVLGANLARSCNCCEGIV